MADTIRQRVLISGVVQGVFFRDSCQQQAGRLGVFGWVRNREDGRVEAVLEGPARRVAVMRDWCRQGPAQARVERVEVTDEPPEGLSTFEVR